MLSAYGIGIFCVVVYYQSIRKQKPHQLTDGWYTSFFRIIFLIYTEDIHGNTLHCNPYVSVQWAYEGMKGFPPPEEGALQVQLPTYVLLSFMNYSEDIFKCSAHGSFTLKCDF